MGYTRPPMKPTIPFISPEETVAALANFSWCALIAVQLARLDGVATSPLAVHAFLTRWLANAQKQKRFPRTVAVDIASLLELGRRKGPGADLYQRLAYLWQSCSAPLESQSDLFRLTWAIEKLKAQGWSNAVVSDEEWNTTELLAEYRQESALLVRKSQLQHGYSEAGKLQGEVNFALNGDVAFFTAVFAEAGVMVLVSENEQNGEWYTAILCQ